MKGVANMPGIGGSLGMCGVCGDSFALEVILGHNVQVVSIDGLDKDVCVHEKCMDALESSRADWRLLPEGPLRRAFTAASRELPPFEPENFSGDEDRP